MTEITSVETERALLGALMINPTAMADAVLYIGDDTGVFSCLDCRKVYETALRLWQDSKTVDAVSIVTASQDISANFIAELMSAVPTSANAARYAEDLRGLADLRAIHMLCSRAQADLNETRDYRAFLDNFESDVFSLTQKRTNDAVQHIRSAAETEVQTLLRILDGQHDTGIPTGYDSLDRYFHGFSGGAVTTIAARPAVGKTAFALNLAYNLAKTGKGVLFFSLEMSRSELVRRLLFRVAKAGYQHMRDNWPSKETLTRRLQVAEQEIEQLPLYIDDSASLTPLEMRAKARRQMVRSQIDVIFIDYMQLMIVPGRHASRENEVSNISRSLKATAKELGVSVVALAQLNRQAVDCEPQLSHLRESGSIEQDSDNVMMLWQDDGNDNIGIKLAKQRSGPTCSVELLFNKELQLFEELEP